MVRRTATDEPVLLVLGRPSLGHRRCIAEVLQEALLGVDIRRERDIEQLRRVALAQAAQIHALVRTL